MAADMKVSLTLLLVDKLSGGLEALSRKLDVLAKLSKLVQLNGLNRADELLARVGNAADGAARKVGGIGARAQSALADLKRLSQQVIAVNGTGTAFLPPSMARAAMTATILAAAAAASGGGTGGGLRLPPPSVPFMSPSPLLLGAPGGIPIPSFNRTTRAGLNYGGAFQAIGSGAAAARTQMALLGTQMQSVNHHMRELGEGALVAAGTGFGLMHPIMAYAKQENIERHIAITENIARERIPAAVAAMDKQFNALALKTGQASEKIAESATFLITTGIGKTAVDRLLPIIAQAATAYNVDLGDSSQGVFTLSHNLKVSDADLPGTISAMALAGKEGHFSFADMSRFLPQIAPVAAKSGLSGAKGARELMAMLEVSRANAATSGEANTNLNDFLVHLFGAPKRGLGHEFARYGVNLTKVLLDAEKKGVSAPHAVLEQVRKLTAGKTEYEANLIIGGLFHNQQSANFVRGALADWGHMQELVEHLQHADSNTILSDFLKAFDAPAVKIRLMEEQLTQLERRLGHGFVVLLDPFNAALGGVLAGLDRIDAAYDRIFGPKQQKREANPMVPDNEKFTPELLPTSITTTLFGYTGGFLALAGVLGLLVPLFKLMRSGMGLLLTPVRWLFTSLMFLGRMVSALLIPALESLMSIAAVLGAPFELGGAAVLAIVAAIGAAAYLIYENWAGVKAWFGRLWDDVEVTFRGLYHFITGVFTGDMRAAKQGLLEIWAGVIGYYYLIWEAVKGPFKAFVSWVDSWTGRGANRIIDAIKREWGALKGVFEDLIKTWRQPFDWFIDDIERRIAALRNSPIGRALGVADPEAPRTGPDGRPLPAPGADPIPPTGAQPAPVNLNIGIRVDQDGRVTRVTPTAEGPAIQFRDPDRGNTAGRP